MKAMPERWRPMRRINRKKEEEMGKYCGNIRRGKVETEKEGVRVGRSAFLRHEGGNDGLEERHGKRRVTVQRIISLDVRGNAVIGRGGTIGYGRTRLTIDESK